MRTYRRIVIAYACEDSGSEPGVGYYWTKSIAGIVNNERVLLITRKNNKVHELINGSNIDLKGIDFSPKYIFIKKYIGVRLYYIMWQFLVLFYLIKQYKQYKKSIIHQVTFTPMYYPPIFFILPFKFIWGPLGGGETYPLKYLKALKLKDSVKEIFRQFIRYSIFVNPLFYFACVRSVKIICSTPETANMIPVMFKKKVEVELMVFDSDKELVKLQKEKTIIIANRLIDWKMSQLFVESFYEFKNENKTEYKLLIIGSGPYFNKIKCYIDNETIIHYKRFEHREEMLKLLKKASLFVSMSLRDSGAASLLEAISYGIPFLVSNSGAHRVFLNRNIGFGFELENYKSDKIKIKNILNKILQDEEVLLKESNKVFDSFNSFFSEDKKRERIQKIILLS
jgi:glycosyltransferase involved in cell wall biosynthesis